MITNQSCVVCGQLIENGDYHIVGYSLAGWPEKPPENITTHPGACASVWRSEHVTHVVHQIGAADKEDA